MKKLFVIAMGILLISIAKAQPAVKILEYRFEIMPAGTGTSSPYYVNNLVLSSASNVTYGPGLTGSTGYTAGVNGIPDLAQWADNWNTVFDANDYNAWTENVIPGGYTLVHDSIVFWTRRSSTGPVNIQLRSSVNGYSNTIWLGVGGGTNVWKKHKITTGLPITSTNVTFRLYGYGSTGTGGTLRIDSLRVYGHLQDVFDLPVEFLSFNGKARENAVDLYWSTASESSNDYFTVFRSKDGVNFEEEVGRVPGAGDAQAQSNYSLVDAWPTPGINYYMLAQTDFDGTTKRLEVVAVYFGKALGEKRILDALGRELDGASHIESTGVYILIDEYGNARKFYTIPP